MLNYDKKLIKLKEQWKILSERHLIESSIVSGEYWIIEGSAIFADGDVGDMNHEAHVISHLSETFLNILGIYEDSPSPLKYKEDEIKDSLIIKKIIIKGDESEELFDRDPADFILNYLLKTSLKKFNNDPKQLTTAFFLAYGSSTQTDARDYGMKYLGWIRVAGNNIQTWTLTQQDMDNISRGINSIIDEQFSDQFDDENSVLSELTFNIESMRNKKFYQDVPLSIIDNADLSGLLAYR
jgi:hypothetical protein